MIKCPLCHWNNAESTQHCQSCGCNLENVTKLNFDKDNPNCYSYTPPRRILEKGVGTLGSGVDLVFRFGMSKLATPLIICKLFLLAVIQYVTMMLYLENNSLFYVLIPISLVLMIDIMGWMIFTRGCRKKKRKLVSMGLRSLYAFHAVSTAYCVIVLLLMFFLSTTIALSGNIENSIINVMDGTSSIVTVSILAVVSILILMAIMFLVICAKFFREMLDVYGRNVLRYYHLTWIIPVVFFLAGIVFSLCTVMLIFYKGNALEFISQYDLLQKYLYAVIGNHNLFISVLTTVIALISLLSGFMVARYIRTYKKMFISK